MRILVIGATGRVGSAALSACLDKHHTVTVLVRNPSKLPLEFRSDPRIKILKGDTSSHAVLVEALCDQEAVIQAAVSSSPLAMSESDVVIRCIISAAREVQASRKSKLLGGGGSGFGKARVQPIRLWVLSGQVLADSPGRRAGAEGDMIPIHPKHYKNYAFLQQEARDVDWSLMCPGKMEMGEVRVLLYECR